MNGTGGYVHTFALCLRIMAGGRGRVSGKVWGLQHQDRVTANGER